VQGGTVAISSCTISGNSGGVGPGNSGGGVFVRFGTVSIVNSLVHSNQGGDGGGVYVYILGTVTIMSSSIYGNTAYTEGGGVLVLLGSVSIVNSKIYSNTAVLGGGVSVSVNGGSVSIVDSQIYSNTAHAYGGGVSVWGDTASIVNSQIYSNIVNSQIYSSNTDRDVRDHLQKFPSPLCGRLTLLVVCRAVVSMSLVAQWPSHRLPSVGTQLAECARAHAQKFPSPRWETHVCVAPFCRAAVSAL